MVKKAFLLLGLLTTSVSFSMEGVKEKSALDVEKTLQLVSCFAEYKGYEYVEGTISVVRISGDCGGCIAYADSLDDGRDRTLQKWKKNLEDCRASSSECQKK